MGISPYVIGALLAGLSLKLPTPYNRLVIFGPGDSRTAMGGGLSGTYGVSLGVEDSTVISTGTSVDAAIGVHSGHRVRRARQKNPGIGGSTAVQCMSYPRPAQIAGGSTGSISGTVMTITAKGGGDNFATGQLVQGPNVAQGCYITSPGTGTGGIGTYNVNISHPVAGGASGASGAITPYYTTFDGFGKDIASIAAHEAAIVILWAGTNGSPNFISTELPAMVNAIRGLTDPTFVYPGYGAPLPLYGGQPKTVILLNETRRGITTLGAVNQQFSSTNAALFKQYSDELSKYSFDSGNALANPRVLVVDSFNAPSIADLTDTTNYNPKPGYWADGLHEGPTAAWEIAKLIGARIAANIGAYDFAPLATTDNLSSVYLQNPCFVTATGGTSFVGSHTLTGSIPASWSITTAGGTTGLTIAVSTAALGANLGNEMIVRITGTANSNTVLDITGTASSAQRNLIALATDTLRGTLKRQIQIDAGNVYASTSTLEMQNGSGANAYKSIVGLQGIALGYGSNTSYPMYLEFGGVSSVETASAYVEATNNVSLKDYVASGNPSVVKLVTSVAVRGSVAVDVTLRISQCGVFKVTD